jgi:hypothetical protein
MWNTIDPQAQYEDVWNRLAHISWKVGAGEPEVTLIQSDIVFVTFDACSQFAQGNVDYLLSDDPSIHSECLAPIETTQQGPSRMTIYEVTPAG